jgi:hypothetical protein
VAHREDFDPILDVPENNSILPGAQSETTLPFAMHRFHVATITRSETCNRFQYPQRRGSVDCAKLQLSFGREGKAHGLFLAEKLFDHFVVVVTHNRLARVRLRNSSPDGRRKHRPNGLLGEELQETLRG